MGDSSLNLNFSSIRLPAFNAQIPNLEGTLNTVNPNISNPSQPTPPTDNANEVQKALKKLVEVDTKTGKATLDIDKDGFVSSKELNAFIESDETLKGKVKAEEVFAAWENAGGKTVKGNTVGEDKNGDRKPDGIDFNGDGKIDDKDLAINNDNIKEVLNQNSDGASFDWKKFLAHMTQIIQQYAQQATQR